MSELAIKVPATRGATLDIIGEKVGRFLVHEDVGGRIARSGAFVEGFSVTLIANGCRFPWIFPTKTTATRFAVGVEKLMNWDDAAVEISENVVLLEPKVKWRKAPTADESKSVVDLAAKCRGVAT